MLVPFMAFSVCRQYPDHTFIISLGNKEGTPNVSCVNLGRSGLKVSRLCLGWVASYGEP